MSDSFVFFVIVVVDLSILFSFLRPHFVESALYEDDGDTAMREGKCKKAEYLFGRAYDANRQDSIASGDTGTMTRLTGKLKAAAACSDLIIFTGGLIPYEQKEPAPQQ